MPFTGTIPDFTVNEDLLAADLQSMSDALSALSDPWTPYAAIWTGSITNPVIGNGVIAAGYWQVGKTVHYKGKITVGSTTTFGSGTWLISLPVTAADIVGAGPAVIFDQSLAATREAASCNLSTTGLIQFWPGTGGGQVAAAVPMGWATSDLLIWSLMYEAA